MVASLGNAEDIFGRAVEDCNLVGVLPKDGREVEGGFGGWSPGIARRLRVGLKNNGFEPSLRGLGR